MVLTALFRFCLMMIAVGVVPWGPLRAEPPANVARDHLSAIEAQRKALIEAIEGGPLIFRRALFVTEVPSRFGEFLWRSDQPFEVGESMHIYIEPVGLVWKRRDGLWSFEVVVGLEIMAADGRIVASEKDFGRIAVNNQDRLTEVMTYLTLSVSDAPPGAYAIRITFRDVNSDKRAMFTLPFLISDASTSTRHFIAR